MDAKTAWYLFETTGNVQAYLLYQDVVNQKAKQTSRNALGSVNEVVPLKQADQGHVQPPFSTTM